MLDAACLLGRETGDGLVVVGGRGGRSGQGWPRRRSKEGKYLRQVLGRGGRFEVGGCRLVT